MKHREKRIGIERGMNEYKYKQKSRHVLQLPRTGTPSALDPPSRSSSNLHKN